MTTFNHRPQNDPWDAADIGTDPVIDYEYGVDDRIAYGDSFAAIVEKADGFIDAVLVNLATAGYTPFGTAGIRALLLACHAYNLAQARQHESEGVIGDALNDIDPNSYRRLGMLLEDLIAEAEERTAELHETESVDDETVPAGVHELWRRQADSARARADRAQRRRQAIADDINSSCAEIDWYTNPDNHDNHDDRDDRDGPENTP